MNTARGSAFNKSIEADITLLGFNAIDMRDVKAGDIVIFRTTSLGHSRELPLRHGRTCKVLEFARNRRGDQQLRVRFRVAPELGDTETSDGLTAPVDLSPINLVAKTPEAFEAAKQVHNRFVAPLVAQSLEMGRPWMARLKLQTALGDLGMYDRLAEQQPRTINQLPY